MTEADQVNFTLSKYDYGMDQLVRLDNRNEGRSFFHLDFLGSIVGLTNNLGATRQSIFYDAWGNERDRIGASANNFTFTGQEVDRGTGLFYFDARFYDPLLGRFLSQDRLLGEERLGSMEADYSIRVLQSRKKVIAAAPIKDGLTGNMRTELF